MTRGDGKPRILPLRPAGPGFVAASTAIPVAL